MDDERLPREPSPTEIECGMCHQRMPAAHTRTVGGRVLCFGCLSGWYEEDDESDDNSSKIS